MNKTEKEYYKKCVTRHQFPQKIGGSPNKATYPVCVYYDIEKGRCELNFCYREVKEKGAKE